MSHIVLMPKPVRWGWDPDNSGADFTFDLPATQITGKTGITGFQTAANEDSRSSGKWYWEIVWTTLNSGCGQCYGVGVGQIESIPINDRFGIFNYEFLWQEATAIQGVYLTNNTPVLSGIGFVQGDIVMGAMDLSAFPAKLWWGKNNVWNAGGNPAAGTGQQNNIPNSGNYTPGVSIWAIDPDVDVTGHFRTRDITYTPPAGFTAIGG